MSNNVTYGITDYGFQKKDIETIYNEIFDDFESATGIKVNRNYDSILGSLVKVIASREAQNWQLMEDVYYSGYPATASGASLDNAVALTGITPYLPIASRQFCKCTTSNFSDVNVPAGTEVTQSGSSRSSYKSVSNQYITQSKCIYAKLMAKLTFAATYNLTIDEISASISCLDANMTLKNIVDYLVKSFSNLKNKDNIKITVADNYSYITIESIDKKTPFYLDTTVNNQNGTKMNENLYPSEYSSLLRFDNTDLTDIVAVEKGKIDTVVSEIKNFTQITNELDTETGRLSEYDQDLRARWLQSMSFTASAAHKTALKYNIINNIGLVKYCEVYENNTDTTNDLGLLPHSIMAIVEGGDDTEIAKYLYKATAAGIDFNGNKTVSVDDEYGNSHDIKFNRPVNKPVYIDVEIIRDNNYVHSNWTYNTIEEVKTAIENYFDSMTCNKAVSAKKIESLLVNMNEDIDDVNIYLSTVNLDNASSVDGGVKIIPANINYHYTFDSKKGVKIYVVDQRNS